MWRRLNEKFTYDVISVNVFHCILMRFYLLPQKGIIRSLLYYWYFKSKLDRSISSKFEFALDSNIGLKRNLELEFDPNSNSPSISHSDYISYLADDDHEIRVAVFHMVFQSFRLTHTVLNGMGTWELVKPSLTCFSILERFIRLWQTANVWFNLRISQIRK